MSDKPYFLNMRHTWEFPYYKKLIWKLFGKKTVGVDVIDGLITTTVTAYTLFHITYVDKVEQS